MSEHKAGRELDARVAALMGWRPSLAGNYPWQMQPPDDESVVRMVPHYSTDIAAAWTVVEKLRADDLRPVLMPDWGTRWQCVIYRQAEYIAQSAFVDSLPLAICQAALAAIEVPA